jgi:hypothetical protein
MKKEDFPALYRSASALTHESQKHFFFALKLHLVLLVVGAVLSVVNISTWEIAVLQAFAFLGALSCSIYLFTKRPDRYWYAGRAVAESIKTITWRFVSRAEPFNTDDAASRSSFHQKLRAIIDQNKDVAGALSSELDGAQVTDAMIKIRALPLEDRKAVYSDSRIKDQLTWYAKKAAFNRKASRNFFAALILTNVIAVICAVLRVRFLTTPVWPTDVFVAIAASLLSWMQAKRYSELASSYALAAHEISLIREQALLAGTDDAFSSFVGDAENAFSREHTQWVARKDA